MSYTTAYIAIFSSNILLFGCICRFYTHAYCHNKYMKTHNLL